MAYHDLPNKARRAWAMTHPAGRTILPQAPTLAWGMGIAQYYASRGHIAPSYVPLNAGADGK